MEPWFYLSENIIYTLESTTKKAMEFIHSLFDLVPVKQPESFVPSLGILQIERTGDRGRVEPEKFKIVYLSFFQHLKGRTEIV